MAGPVEASVSAGEPSSPWESTKRDDLLEFIRKGPTALLRTLDFLQVYVDKGSQNQVADLRGVVASTVSESLKGLDAAVVGPDSLTDQRSIQQIAHTSDGQEVLARASEVLHAAEEFVAAYRKLRGRRSLLVASYNAQIKNVLAQAIERFNVDNESSTRVILPRTMGGFRRVSHSDLQRELKKGYTDYILASLPDGSQKVKGMKTKDLYSFQLLVVAGPDHEIMTRSKLEVSELLSLADTGFLVGPDGYLSREVFRDISRKADRPLDITMENPDTNTRVALARAGYGIALVHDDSIDPGLMGDYPVLVGDDEVVTAGSVFLGWVPGESCDGPANVLADDHRRWVDCLVAASDAHMGAGR